MSKKTLKTVTPVGTFTRKTDSNYSHVNVWASPRAARVLTDSGAHTSGVDGRWKKDNGFGVTWHYTEGAARKAAAGQYGWDRNATIIGTFAVEA